MISIAKALSAELSNICQPWAIVGSANLVLRGYSDSADDIDIITTKEGVSLIFRKLKRHAVRELEWSEADNIKSDYFAAVIRNVRIDVMGDPINRIKGIWVPNVNWYKNIEKIEIEDTIIPLTNLGYEKGINEQLQNVSRVREIENCLMLINL